MPHGTGFVTGISTLFTCTCRQSSPSPLFPLALTDIHSPTLCLRVTGFRIFTPVAAASTGVEEVVGGLRSP